MEDKFKKEFSKRIAEALLENEEHQHQQQHQHHQPSVSIHDEFHDSQALEAYRQMCYDDPILQNDQDCAALGETLICNFTDLYITEGKLVRSSYHDSQNNNQRKLLLRLGLCDRLVEGVLQGIHKWDHHSNPSVSSQNAENALVPHGIAERGYVDLAFTIFGEGLRCCCKEIVHAIADWEQASHTEERSFYLTLPQCHAFLGSFTGCLIEEQGIGIHTKEVSTCCAYDDSINNLYNLHNNKSSDSIPYDDFVEVFAEESDSDDYDYAQNTTTAIMAPIENSTHEVTLSHLQEMDPLLLSQPPSYSSKSLESSKDILHKLYLLIQRLSFSMFASISTQRWKDLKVSQTLSDLVLELLCLFCFETQITQQVISQESDTDNTVTASTKDDIVHRIQRLGSSFVLPIQILRDKCLDQTQYFHCMDDYVLLLIKLVQNKSIDIQSIGLSLLLDLASLFQRNKLLDRVPNTNISMAFTKKQLILRNAILSIFHPVLQSLCFMRLKHFATTASSSLSSLDSTGVLDEDPTWAQNYILHQSPFAFVFLDITSDPLLEQEQQITKDTWDLEIVRYVQGKEKHDLNSRNGQQKDNVCNDMDRILAHQAVKYILKKLDNDKQVVDPIKIATVIPSNLSRRNNKKD